MKHMSVLLAAAMAAMPIASQAAVLDFQALEQVNNVVKKVGTSHDEDGFRITQGPNEPNPLAVYGTLGSLYPGSTALFSNTVGGLLTLTRIGGGAFDLLGIDLSELNGSEAVSVTFDGVLALGGSVMQTFTLNATFGMETFSFGSLFTDVVSVSWRQVANFHQFDNIVVEEVAPVPVPAAFAMLALGLGGLGVMRRRKG